jgi:hypothetical protein
MRGLCVNKKGIQEQSRIKGKHGVEPVVGRCARDIEFLGEFQG